MQGSPSLQSMAASARAGIRAVAVLRVRTGIAVVAGCRPGPDAVQASAASLHDSAAVAVAVGARAGIAGVHAAGAARAGVGAVAEHAVVARRSRSGRPRCRCRSPRCSDSEQLPSPSAPGQGSPACWLQAPGRAGVGAVAEQAVVAGDAVGIGRRAGVGGFVAGLRAVAVAVGARAGIAGVHAAGAAPSRCRRRCRTGRRCRASRSESAAVQASAASLQVSAQLPSPSAPGQGLPACTLQAPAAAGVGAVAEHAVVAGAAVGVGGRCRRRSPSLQRLGAVAVAVGARRRDRRRARCRRRRCRCRRRCRTRRRCRPCQPVVPQVGEQQSPEARLPSSHPSVISSWPLPHSISTNATSRK